MKVVYLLLAVAAAGFSCNSENETKAETKETAPAKNELPSTEIQIKLAVLAAPAEKRDSCTVYGYNADNELVLLRQGTNELICLADNPNDTSFSVSSYFKELEPFMQRGRELKKQGMNDQQIFEEREKEVQAGTLQMPKEPASLYAYSAKLKDVDFSTGEVKDGYLRYVIYIPYATAESTGLPLKPSTKGMPWIMNPGTHRAHIMINP